MAEVAQDGVNDMLWNRWAEVVVDSSEIGAHVCFLLNACLDDGASEGEEVPELIGVVCLSLSVQRDNGRWTGRRRAWREPCHRGSQSHVGVVSVCTSGGMSRQYGGAGNCVGTKACEGNRRW